MELFLFPLVYKFSSDGYISLKYSILTVAIDLHFNQLHIVISRIKEHKKGSVFYFYEYKQNIFPSNTYLAVEDSRSLEEHKENL